MKEFALANSGILYFGWYFRSLLHHKFLHTNLFSFFSSMSALAILFALTCFASLRRNYPLNFIILFVFTSIISVELSVLCVRSPVHNVYTSCFLTAGLFALLTFLAYLNIVSVLCFELLLSRSERAYFMP